MADLYKLTPSELKTIIFALRWYDSNFGEVKTYLEEDDDSTEKRGLLEGHEANNLSNCLESGDRTHAPTQRQT